MREHLLYKKTAPTAVIQLHRTDKKNSLNSKLRQEMQELLEELVGDATIRAVIPTGGETLR
jgi:enoyl-CoA hydratase/carnithine racemase